MDKDLFKTARKDLVRNIRNLLLSGISEAHVKKVCSYISNETAVTKSRMFPFQFFTAYDVLSEVKQLEMS